MPTKPTSPAPKRRRPTIAEICANVNAGRYKLVTWDKPQKGE